MAMVDLESLISVDTDDPQLAMRGRALNILLLSFFAVLILVSIVMVIHQFIDPSSSYGMATIFNGIFVSSVIIFSYLLSVKGYVNHGVNLFLVGLIFGTTSALIARGNANAIILVYPIIIISAGLLLGPRSAFAYALVSVLFYGVAELTLQSRGAVLFDDASTMALNNYLAVLASLFVIAIVTWLFTRGMANYVKELEKRDREKEVLLKEIHHRVKNNLQIVSSILSLQKNGLEDPDAREVMDDSVGRVKSMALIHERLYMSKDLSSIDIKRYINDLVSIIIHSQHEHVPRFEMNYEVQHPHQDVDTSISLGLIINELVTNSIKHGYPGGEDMEKGLISIFLKESNGQYVLSVSDDGIGIPQDMDFRKTESLGLQLVCTLVEEMDGEIRLDRAKGTRFIISFKGGGE